MCVCVCVCVCVVCVHACTCVRACMRGFMRVYMYLFIFKSNDIVFILKPNIEQTFTRHVLTQYCVVVFLNKH